MARRGVCPLVNRQNESINEPAARAGAKGRLRWLAQSCISGRVQEAMIELSAWVRDEDVPAEARVLYAALLANQGELARARQVLSTANDSDTGEGPELEQLRYTLLARAGMPEEARLAAKRLQHKHYRDESIHRWLSCVDAALVGLISDDEQPVCPLARELLARPHVIPSLLAGMRVGDTSEHRGQLLSALRQVVAKLNTRHDRINAHLALAELAAAEGDMNEARRWVKQGMKLQPRSVPFAMLLHRLTDQQAAAPEATRALTNAAEDHPEYPDVQAALIRREKARGDLPAARLRFQQLKDRLSDHPMVRGLEQELAA